MRRISARRDERGAILVLATAGIVVAVIAATLAVDLGQVAQEARRNQKLADLAALDAVRALPNDPTQAATDSLTRNGFYPLLPGSTPLVEPGLMSGGSFTPLPMAAVATANAVRVSVTSQSPKAFASGRTVTRKAIATRSNPLGTVRVGSTVLSLTPTIFNKLLPQVFGGSTYNMDLVGYQGLASGNVEFQRLRTALGVGVGQVNQLGSTTFSMRQILDASIVALNQQGGSSTAVATKLGTIASQITTTAGTKFSLLKLFDVVGNVGTGTDVANATLNVMDILTAGAILADSNHLATFDLLAADIPVIPGVQSIGVRLGLIEAPQIRSGAPGKNAVGVYRTTAKTSQVRLALDVRMRLPLAGLGLVDLNVPFYVDAGNATASLDSMTCAGSAQPSSVDIWGSTSAATVKLGQVTDANLSNQAITSGSVTVNNAQIFSITVLSIVNVTASANNIVTQTIPGNPGVMLSFSPPYNPPSDTNFQTVPGVAPLTSIALPTISVGDLTVGVNILGSLNLDLIKLDLATGINLALPGVSTAIVAPLLESVGLRYAEAHVWAPPVQTCQPTSFDSGDPTVVRPPILAG